MTASVITSSFDFEVVLLNAQGYELRRDRRQADSFTEILKSGTPLEMVQIPAGTAQIGSPKTEAERLDNEDEPHLVTLPSFFMSKYPITQALWKAVALLPQVTDPLSLEPSYFRGLDRPVEQVSWYDAIEFCARLSLASGRSYRLPTEVEWEYACRAQTTTPFHFGETLTTDLANYCGETRHVKKRGRHGHLYSGSYAEGSTGIDRQETTAVGSLQTANGFGLYDMHGNVWEWCALYPDAADTDQAKSDDSAMLSGEPDHRPLRGGAWKSSPAVCRSASRSFKLAGCTESFIGFRVVYSPADYRPKSAKPSQSQVLQSLFSNIQVGGNVRIGNVTQNIIIESPPQSHDL